MMVLPSRHRIQNSNPAGCFNNGPVSIDLRIWPLCDLHVFLRGVKATPVWPMYHYVSPVWHGLKTSSVPLIDLCLWSQFDTVWRKFSTPVWPLSVTPVWHSLKTSCLPLFDLCLWPLFDTFYRAASLLSLYPGIWWCRCTFNSGMMIDVRSAKCRSGLLEKNLETIWPSAECPGRDFRRCWPRSLACD